MSAPAEICDTCGKTITDEELEIGSAISVLGKSYCPACKAAAIKDISLEDLAGHPVPAAAPVMGPAKAPAPAPKPAPLEKSAAPPGKTPPARPGFEPTRVETPRDLPGDVTPRTLLALQAAKRKAAPARGGSKTPFLVAAGAALVAVAVTLLVLPSRGGPDKKGKPDPDPSGATPKGLAPAPADTAPAKAEKAYRRVSDIARRAGTKPDEILAAADQARADCRGTPFEAKLEELRGKALQEKEQAEAAKGLQPLVDELRSAVAADPKFARYAELDEKFRRAKELAVRAGSGRVGEIGELWQGYSGRYEQAAEAWAREQNVEETAKVLSDEKRYDDALAKIDTFPRELRLSGAWRGLEHLKQDIEKLKKIASPKK